ncbi:ATP-binding cassette domain-containing protein, partial [Enterobacter hormaechei]|uniref:ATP-binding cassette domain-containing protein n=1 Tax=Enterobacter hormaechei TaxID=158836 RepID=UPI00203F45A3
MLKIENLHARIGDKEILKGLSLDVKPGQVHAIMGPNGAGKSSLMRTLSTLQEADSGTATLSIPGEAPIDELRDKDA